jgi:hypothetical protein
VRTGKKNTDATMAACAVFEYADAIAGVSPSLSVREETLSCDVVANRSNPYLSLEHAANLM